MAKVLQNFLIGVGLDTEKYDKGAKNVQSSLGRMRSLVGITGAAITGAFAAAGTVAIGAGRRIDQLSLAFEKFKTPPQFIYDYRNAIAALGGSADEAVAAINTAESAIASFRKTGQLPGLDDLVLAGVNVQPLLTAETGQDFLRELAKQIPDLSQEGQLRVQETLGLSDAVMRSLRGGVQELDKAVARSNELAGGFADATDASREFNKELAEFNTRLEGIGNTLAEKMLPGFTGVLNLMGGFIDRNRDVIGKGAEVLGDNPTAAALMTGSGAAAATGAGLRMIGMRPAGMALTRLGVPGMIAGGALIGGDMAYDHVTGLDWAGLRNNPGGTAKDAWRIMTGRERKTDSPDTPYKQPGRDVTNVPYGPEVPNVGPGSISPRQAGSYGLVTPYEKDGKADSAVTATEYVPVLTPESDPYARPDAKEYQPNINVVAPDVREVPVLLDPYSGVVEYPDAPNEPVYSGGEVNNVEAANASPDVVMVKDQRRQSEAPVVPQRINMQNHLDVKLELDGRQFETKVTEVVERRERNTADDLLSSVAR